MLQRFAQAETIRARFSAAMSAMYRTEVPAYGTLMSLVAEVNTQALADNPGLAADLSATGEIARISDERHGAIRLGTAAELAMMARVFAVMGMEPVGYYDLTEASVPVHSTAFRPVGAEALTANPFRVFTSLLRLDLVADEALRAKAEAVLAARQIFTPAAVALVEKAEAEGGLTEDDAEAFVTEVLETFRWHDRALVSSDLYHELHEAHRLIADVVSFKGPHINHLTPRTLDIDAVQTLMPARGIAPKAVIEGPPRRRCPILLRQTSFKALEEPVSFRDGDTWTPGHHTARFGEIEERGQALTPKGRALYDRLLTETRAKVRPAPDGSNAAAYEAALAETFRAFPDDLATIRAEGLGYFAYVVTPGAKGPVASLDEALARGLIRATPLTYEDFLPVSAAGIFQSNLGDEAAQDFAASPNQRRFEADLGRPVLDDFAHYAAIEAASAAACLATLGVPMTPAAEARQILARLGATLTEGPLVAHSPVTGEETARLAVASAADTQAAILKAEAAFKTWRLVPAPRRGELVRLLGEELRAAKTDLGRLVSIEAGKSVSEGLGEVQEMIDICDFALGLSRQLYGLTIATERPGHRMMETWHPLGVVGVITAFNFPVAVWAWNAALALICGDAVIWKPSEKTPLTALATQAIFAKAAARFGAAPEGLAQLLIGAGDIGAALVDSPKVALISATGSTRMGRIVGPKVAARFGRSILELGGNNAGIVCPSADLDMALRAIAFGAMGTAGQRCTTMRRLFVHASVADALIPRLKKAWESVSVGNPLTSQALVGPLVDGQAYDAMQKALDDARALGGKVTGGTRVDLPGHYVRPALVEMPAQAGPVLEETFAPILYVMTWENFDEVIAAHNAVGAGLSSSIFTTDLREMEAFLSAAGSDCGIANVNIGTSGAEIGGAFGGEKETGGGRESGSDAWKGYMRRATNTINFSRELPLAQGVVFDL